MNTPPAPGLFRPSTLTGSLRLYIPANAVWRFLGLVRNVLLTWLLPAVEFGRFGLALMLINVVVPLAGLGLHETVTRYIPAFEGRDRLWPFVRRAIALTLISASVVGVVVIAGAPWFAERVFQRGTDIHAIGPAGPELITLCRWTGVAIVTLTLYQLMFGLLRGARLFMALSLMECCSAAVFTGLAIATVVYWHASASAVLATYCVSFVVAGVAFGIPGVRTLRQSQVVPDRREAGASRSGTGMGFGLWLAMSAVLWQLLQFVPVWMLNRQHGEGATAVFTAARQITQILIVAAFAVSVVVAASVNKRWESDGPAVADRQWALSFKATSLALFGVAVALVLGRAWIVLIFERSYRDGVSAVMPVLLLFSLVAGNQSLLALHFALIERTRRVAVAWLFGIVAVLLVGPSLIDTHHVIGAAWVGVLAIAITLVVSLVLLVISGRPLDRGTVILLFAPALLAAPVGWLVAGTAVLVLAAARTELILTANERQGLRAAGHRLLRRP